MHPNPAFRQTPEALNIAFARERSFGTLAINGQNGPLLSHIPFQLSQDGKSLEAHLVRSNPITGELKEPKEVVIAVTGPDAYISPDWYGIDDQVPTWNYVAVHLRGSMRLANPSKLQGILERLSEDMERRLLPKPVWSLHKMTEGVFERMCRQIVPVTMQVGQIEGSWKLSQNKPEGVPQRAAQNLTRDGFGTEVRKLADLMND